MKRGVLKLSAAVILIGGGFTIAEAGFGDAVVGGVVGGVVGSVITNSVYHSSHSSSHSSTRHYRKKHRSEPVETDEMKIQKALKSLGFYRGPIDGQLNSFETRTAIKELNRAYEIDDTAYMSPQERDALVYLGTLLDFDKKLAATGNSRRVKNKRIQTALKILGFYHGKIDGSTGPMTRRAIADYRMANGFGSGYKLGYEDEYRLISTARKGNDRNIEDTIATLKRMGRHRSPQSGQVQPANNNYNAPSPQQGQSGVNPANDGPAAPQQGGIVLQPVAN